MATVKKKTSKKKATKKKVTRKKAPPVATHRKAATDTRHALVKQLRRDLKDTKETLKVVNAAAKAEITVLKDELKAALKRENKLVKLGRKKLSLMLAAGEKWERKQVRKIRKIVAKKRRK